MTAATAARHTTDELMFLGTGPDDENLAVFYFRAESSRDRNVAYTVSFDRSTGARACDCPAGRRHEERGVTCWHLDLVERAAYLELAERIIDGVRDDRDGIARIGKMAADRVRGYGDLWSLANPLDLLVRDAARAAYLALAKKERGNAAAGVG